MAARPSRASTTNSRAAPRWSRADCRESVFQQEKIARTDLLEYRFDARRSSNHDPEQQHQPQPGDPHHCTHDRPGLDGLTHAHAQLLLDEPETDVVDGGE